MPDQTQLNAAQVAHRAVGKAIAQHSADAAIEALTSCLAEIVVAYIAPSRRQKFLRELAVSCKSKTARIAQGMQGIGIPDHDGSAH